MSKQHGARQQKRLAKQKAKRADRRHELAKRTSSNPVIRFKSADRWPITTCLLSEGVWEVGMGQAVIARKMPDGALAFASFLLDVFCLGVKDALWQILSVEEFNRTCESLSNEGRFRTVEPEYLAKLVYQTADFGQSLGFRPHPSFRTAQRILAGIDPSQCSNEFEFGRDGRPLYIRGPNETLEQAAQISELVSRLGGNAEIPMKLEESLSDWPDADAIEESEL